MLAEQVQTTIAALIITLVAAVVARRGRLPYTLVLVVVGVFLGILHLLPTLHLEPDIVLYIFLPALLFEGAWSMDLRRLRADWLAVVLFAGPGLVVSWGIVAAFAHWGAGLDWLSALLLGAIVSPTDPVAVLALFRQLGIDPRLRTIIEGESLFNDGVGAAIVAILLIVIGNHPPPSALGLTTTGIWELIGGPLIGLGIGAIVAQLLRLVQDHLIETATTFSVAYGVFLIATAVHTSGLLAVVMAGLVLSGPGRRVGLSEEAVDTANEVWEFIGYIANSLLFLVVGVQIGATSFIAAIPAIIWVVLGVVMGRGAMLAGLVPLLNGLVQRLGHQSWRGPFPPPRAAIPGHWRPILLFAGLRGALSLALVLSLGPEVARRDLLVGTVYGVVLVTLLGQGIGLRIILPRWQRHHAAPRHNA